MDSRRTESQERLTLSRDAVPLVQGAYFVATGLWPIVHLRSFEKVVGPKVDRWLVKTFGALVGAVGATLLGASRERSNSRSLQTLGVGTALALATAEVIYVSKRRISPVYLVDVLVELALVAGWLGRARRPMPTQRSRRRNDGRSVGKRPAP